MPEKCHYQENNAYRAAGAGAGLAILAARGLAAPAIAKTFRSWRFERRMKRTREKLEGWKETPTRRFDVVLLIRHPNADPGEISRELSLQPYQAFKKGEARALPNGNLLPGLATQSAWNHVFRHTGEQHIDKAVEAVLKILEDHKAFVRRLCMQGWTFEIYLQLPGDVNFAGVLSWQLAKRMGDLRIDFGLEVFPNFK